MDPDRRSQAVRAATSVAVSLGLAVDEAVVLHDSNRVVVRLLPCDTVARVAPTGWFGAATEIEVAARLARAPDAPVAGPDPRVEARVVGHDGFQVTMWTHVHAVVSNAPAPEDYASALERLHDALRRLDVDAPPVTDRFAEVRTWLRDADVTPDLSGDDRALLVRRLEIPRRRRAGRQDQLLHGEPHPWNLLITERGPLFVDFENCARGPIEYDLAWVPRAISELRRDADQELVGEYRRVVLAIVAAHRWRRDDRHPSGRVSGVAFLDVLRAGPPWPSLDAVRW